MPVLNEISVGPVVYQLVEGAPTHSATAGVVALDKESGRYFVYSNRWDVLINPSYGGIYFTGSSVTTDTDSTTGAWVFDASTSIGGTSPGSYRNDPDMLGFTSSFNGSLRIIDPSNTGRYLITTTTTFTNITDSHLVEVFPYIYNISATKTLSPVRGISSELMRSSATFTNFKMTIGSKIISEILPGQGISLAKRYRLPTTVTSGYKIENNSIQVLKLEDAVISYVINEEWSSGTFSTNSWTVVNDTTNKWVIGTAATASTGSSYSAYISSNLGVSHVYSNTTNISHFYRDFSIPNQSGDFYLSFDWKCNGEDSVDASRYDFGTVFISLTSSTPTAGNEIIPGGSVATIVQGGPTGSGRIGSSNSGKYNSFYGGADSFWRQELILLNNYKGLTRRLTFSWINDNLTLNQPPFAVDNIKVFRRIYI